MFSITKVFFGKELKKNLIKEISNSYLILYIEMKFQDFSSLIQFKLTHVRYLIYILIHYKLKESRLISNVIFYNEN